MSRRERPRGTFQVTTLIAGALLLLILFVTAGYLFWLVPGGEKPDDNFHARQEARWLESEPDSYRYVVQRRCECNQETRAAYVVSVSNGEATIDFPIPIESEYGRFLDAPTRPDTIADVFAAIRKAQERGDEVVSGYDRSFGFPATVTIFDARGERGWEIRDFEVLNAIGD